MDYCGLGQGQLAWKDTDVPEKNQKDSIRRELELYSTAVLVKGRGFWKDHLLMMQGPAHSFSLIQIHERKALSSKKGGCDFWHPGFLGVLWVTPNLSDKDVSSLTHSGIPELSILKTYCKLLETQKQQSRLIFPAQPPGKDWTVFNKPDLTLLLKAVELVLQPFKFFRNICFLLPVYDIPQASWPDLRIHQPPFQQ